MAASFVYSPGVGRGMETEYMMWLKDAVYVLKLLPEAVRAAVHGPEVKYYFRENNIPSVGAASETG